mgnify:CR=1 FL=1
MSEKGLKHHKTLGFGTKGSLLDKPMVGISIKEKRDIVRFMLHINAERDVSMVSIELDIDS